jgi:hypothetical protein
MFSSKPRIPKRRTAGDPERQMPSNYKGIRARQPELKVRRYLETEDAKVNISELRSQTRPHKPF